MESPVLTLLALPSAVVLLRVSGQLASRLGASCLTLGASSPGRVV